MAKVNQVKRDLNSKKERKDALTKQKNDLVERIDIIERRRNTASITQKPELENALTDYHHSLNAIKSEIHELEDQIETLEIELQKLENSNSDEANDVNFGANYSDDYTDDDNIGVDDLTKDDSDEESKEEKSSNVDLGNFGNVKRNYYLARSEELKKYETNLKTPSFNDAVISKTVQAVDLIRTEDPIRKIVLYVATFFPKLSKLDFERVVAFLLEGKPLSIVNISTEFDEKEDSKKNILQTNDLYSDWKRSDGIKSSKIMEECHLVSVYIEDDTQAVDFKFTYLRNDLKTYFNNDPSPYLDRQFQRAKLLLFDLSVAVIRNVIVLSVEMANSNPNIHGGEWLADILNLFRLFTNFKQLTERGFSTTEVAQLLFSDPEKQEEFELFARLLSQIDEKYRGEFLISRVAFLIERMLEYPKLKPIVNNFLQNEIDTQNQETVLALITLLQSVPAFDWLFWIEKLLNEKSALIGSYTRQILTSQLEQSQNIYDILNRIWSWVPKVSTKKSDYTQAQIYALRLIYKYSYHLTDKLKFSDYGCYPPKYQLFANLGDRTTDENLKLLVKWVFHPEQKYFVKAPIKEASRLIADWFSILYGLDESFSHSKSQALANKLLLQILTTVSSPQQYELRKYWNEQTNILLREANKAQKSRKSWLQKRLMQKRYSVIKLIEQFVNLQESTRS